MSNLERIELVWYCRCGAVWKFVAYKPDFAALTCVIAIWEAGHQGEGHGKTDERGARLERQRQQRQRARERRKAAAA